MVAEEKKTILLVDDDPSLLLTLSDFLDFEGYRVVTAESGEQGLLRLEEVTPDLIILDMSMPGMGGVGFLKRISSDKGVPKYPVLVLTARASMAEFFANIDVDGFVAKPCDPGDLLMEVGRIIFLRSGTSGDERAVSAAPGKQKVLIGEDDEIIADNLVSAFAEKEFIVARVSRGPDVLEKAIVERPDIIVIRYMLTGMNGDVVAEMLAAMPSTGNTPVVLYDDGESVATLREKAGANVRKIVGESDATLVCAEAIKVLKAE